MLRALKAEALKLKRSKMPFWTALAVVLMPLMFVGGPSTDGPLDTFGSFLRVGPQLIAGYVGVVLFGLVAAYLFGREYSDGTAKYMLTLPVRRESFVMAKMLLLAGWVAALTLLSVGVHTAYAGAMGLDGFAWNGVATSLADSLKVSLLIFLTLPIVALLAMAGRSYLQPMIFSAVMSAAGVSFTFVGWERWFPWSMPVAQVGIILGPPIRLRPLVPGSWAVALATFAVGLAALLWYVDRADNHQ